MVNIFSWFILFVLAFYITSVISALILNKRLKSKMFDGIPWADCFKPKKIFSVIFGWTLSFFVPRETLEQFSIRFTNEQCKECYRTGRCVYAKRPCGCDPYKMACSPWERCKNGNWGPIMSVDKWRKLKEQEREFLKNQKNIDNHVI